MTEKEKQLLLIDLCARLPYYTFVEWDDGYAWLSIDRFRDIVTNKFGNEWKRPYLRPMSSMTEDEKVELTKITHSNIAWFRDEDDDSFNLLDSATIRTNAIAIDWLNAHYFDYRGLIPMGLALEAKEGMYDRG